jgi:TfoX/Sxy family transcriptional regulator of competence genes
MPYDERLAARIRPLLTREPAMDERKMFGGVAFLLNGHMCCGVVKDTLMVRVGPEQYQDALAQPHARLMDFTGRPLTGMVYVDAGGYRSDKDLKAWVQRGVRHAKTLPPKGARNQRAARTVRSSPP